MRSRQSEVRILPTMTPWLNFQLEKIAGGMEPDLTLSGEDAAERFTRIEQKNMSALLQRRGLPMHG